MEVNPASSYIAGGGTNKVAEMDGRTGFTTVMQQTFTVARSGSTTLTLKSALRTASLPKAGLEGFTVEILNSSGAVVATMTVKPTTTTWNTYSLPITFPAAGSYTVRFTELGPDDSLGAIIDNVSLLVCFAGQTRIRMERGEYPKAWGNCVLLLRLAGFMDAFCPGNFPA